MLEWGENCPGVANIHAGSPGSLQTFHSNSLENCRVFFLRASASCQPGYPVERRRGRSHSLVPLILILPLYHRPADSEPTLWSYIGRTRSHVFCSSLITYARLDFFRLFLSTNSYLLSKKLEICPLWRTSRLRHTLFTLMGLFLSVPQYCSYSEFLWVKKEKLCVWARTRVTMMYRSLFIPGLFSYFLVQVVKVINFF